MRFLIAFLLAAAFAISAASADITIRNFNGGGVVTVNTVMQYDDDGNAVDAHDGQILQAGSTFYLIGTSYGCGFVWNTGSTDFCGFNVYSSSDLGYNKKWHREGLLFDVSTWQSKCGLSVGCFELRAIYNPTTSKYVFWFLEVSGVSAPDDLQVFTCSTPTCGATQSVPGTPTFQTAPSALVHGPASSSVGLFVDTDNSCYVMYNNPVGARENYIDKLNSTCTESTGVSADTNLTGEGAAIMLRGGVYYAFSGGLCPYCNTGASSSYSTASSIMGTYSASTQLSAISCNGQFQSVNTIVSGGTTTYLFSADQWTGSNAEGQATIYYKPLTFSSPPAIDTLTCDTTVTVQGVTPDPNPSPTLPANADQTSVAIGYHDLCDLSSTRARMQTFVPASGAVSTIYMPLAQNQVTGNLTVSLVTVDGSNNPVTTLASKTYSPGDLRSAGTWTALPLRSPLTPGNTYGITLVSASAAGCYSAPLHFGTFPNPYPAGVERTSTDGGATWTTEATNHALMFATVPPIAGAGRFPFRH